MVASINRVAEPRSTSLLWGYADCATGSALVAAVDGQICRIDLNTGPNAEATLRADWPELCEQQHDLRDDAAVQKLVTAAFAEAAAGGSPALVARGTPFQLLVWRALTQIPPGDTRSYGELAAVIGRPRAARAVGSATAANTIALLIPCHRLVPATGGSGAYRWGAELKQRLLATEAATGRPAGAASAVLAA